MTAKKAIVVTIATGEAADKIGRAAAALDGPGARSLWRALAGTLEAQTAQNFEAQGRPQWAPLAKRTLAERMKRNKGSSVLKILQDTGALAGSIHSWHDDHGAGIGAGKVYAAIHQYGGTIERPAYSVKTRLRTDAKGNLVRQKDHANLAVFAKDRHKRARESWSTVDAFKIDIPARPYLPFSGAPGAEVLQPQAEQALLDALARHVMGLF